MTPLALSELGPLSRMMIEVNEQPTAPDASAATPAPVSPNHGRVERLSDSRHPQASRVHLHRSPWRVVAARVVINGLAVALVVLILPGVKESTGHPVLGYLALGALFGLINAFVKPAIQFVALPALLSSLGVVVILVDVVTFWLLDALTPLLHTRGLWAVLAAGVVLGVLSFVLDNLLGLVPPIRQEHGRREFAG